MPFQRTRPALVLTQEQQIKLETISRSRTEKASRIERANVLLAYARNASISSIARMLSTKHYNWVFLPLLTICHGLAKRNVFLLKPEPGLSLWRAKNQRILATLWNC